MQEKNLQPTHPLEIPSFNTLNALLIHIMKRRAFKVQ